MSENPEVLILTKRNHKLLNIAKICEIVAWVVLVFYFFYSYTSYTNITQYVETKSISDSSVSLMPSSIDLSNVYFTQLITNPFVYVKIVVDVSIVILQGFVGFLTLYGISYGLKMLVETDLNYRLNLGEKSNDRK